MIIGVPKEIKDNENRVGMVPGGVASLTRAGHQVVVEAGAGAGTGFADHEYVQAGAAIVPTGADVYGQAEMIVKVKEPLAPEYPLFREGQIIFTYLHLASEADLTQALVAKKVTAIAYETIQLADNSLPLLTPMSEVAGRMAVQIGAQLLEKPHGGLGILLGGVPGVGPAEVLIIGGGVVGTNAAKIAVGMGAAVTIIDKNAKRLRELDDLFGGRALTLMSNHYNLVQSVAKADLLIGAVLIPGARAPRLVSEDMVAKMKEGSVIVDVAIDQGGCIETINRVSTHSAPTYVKHGVIHYAVANIPGAVPRTSTLALTNVTLPYVMEIAASGCPACLKENEALAKGLNVADGWVTYQAVAEALGYRYRSWREVF